MICALQSHPAQMTKQTHQRQQVVRRLYTKALRFRDHAARDDAILSQLPALPRTRKGHISPLAVEGGYAKLSVHSRVWPACIAACCTPW
jgi:division protein CdvB (Snf7/Vps24/ESCRT-III family)